MFCLLNTSSHHFVLEEVEVYMNQGYLEYSMQFDFFSVGFRLFTDHLKPIAYEVDNGVRYVVLQVHYRM